MNFIFEKNFFFFFLLSVCFKVFDTDHDGKLGKDELKAMLEALMVIRKENSSPEELVSQLNAY